MPISACVKPAEHGGRRHLISVAQASELIGISRAAVYKAIDKGALRARRIDSVTVVDRASAAECEGGT